MSSENLNDVFNSLTNQHGDQMLNIATNFSDKIADTQEKCSLWNTIFPSGRTSCTEARKSLYKDIIMMTALSDRITGKK